MTRYLLDTNHLSDAVRLLLLPDLFVVEKIVNAANGFFQAVAALGCFV
jgi:hypothetical protein